MFIIKNIVKNAVINILLICKSCQINYLKNYDENEIINNFIQEKQLNVNKYSDQIFEW
jgi:hypothetical protein